ncbi:EamA family transporter [Metabacillus herbersteinensis]|uniref:EamA family transporter n=1 Tax=Metabacillus herbersteinensis TaxID=283816 RepID=A0ABV6GHW6_9BACI
MKGSLFVFLGSCSYGVLSTIVVLSYAAGFTLNDVVGSQMVLGAVLLWFVVLFRFKNSISKKPTRKEIIQMLIAGTSTGLTGLFYYVSLQYLAPSLAVVIFFQFTWIGIIIEAIAKRKTPRKSQLLALIPIFVGTILATNLITDGLASLQLQGVLFGFLAAISNAIFIFVSGRVATKSDPILRSAIMVTGGAILTSIIVPPTFLINFTVFGKLLVSYGLLLAFFGSLFSTWMFAKGAPLISTGLASILSAMQLPTTMILSIAILHVPINLTQIIGIIIILLGIGVSESNLGKKETMIIKLGEQHGN